MYYRNDDVRLEELPRPQVGPGDILVRAMACGICGSDVLEWYRIKHAPRVLGHEMVGEVVETGGEVRGFTAGDRVFPLHHVPCNTCHYCRGGHRTACETLHTTNYDPGGLSEYVRVPALNVDRGVFLLPQALGYDEATLVEPVGCVVRGLRSVRMPPGSTMLVLGSGISGLLHILLSRAFAFRRVFATDIDDRRIELASAFGAAQATRAEVDVPSWVRDANAGMLADLVVVCTGARAAAEQALRCVERGGTVLFFAVPEREIAVPISEYWRNDVTIKTTYGTAPEDIAQAIALLDAGYVPADGLITHRLGLAEAQRGFQLTAAGEQSIKVVVRPQE
jgi:L-iditol 2-dehydrogenase